MSEKKHSSMLIKLLIIGLILYIVFRGGGGCPEGNVCLSPAQINAIREEDGCDNAYPGEGEPFISPTYVDNWKVNGGVFRPEQGVELTGDAMGPVDGGFDEQGAYLSSDDIPQTTTPEYYQIEKLRSGTTDAVIEALVNSCDATNPTKIGAKKIYDGGARYIGLYTNVVYDSDANVQSCEVTYLRLERTRRTIFSSYVYSWKIAKNIDEPAGELYGWVCGGCLNCSED